MRPKRVILKPTTCCALAALAATVGWSSSARAQCPTLPFDGEDFVLAAGEPTNLCGDAIAPHITIAGTVTVAPFAAADPNSGWLHLRADTIRIEATGVINAAGAGYRATTDVPTNVNVSGPGAGATPSAPLSADEPRPGGGASHGGAGLTGMWGQAFGTCVGLPEASCMPFAEAAAGPTYDSTDDPLALQAPQLGMGSAGGASHTGCPNTLGIYRGGHGGGVVLLTAYRIELAGQILADGDSATTLLRSGPGGGSGGSIVLRSRELALTSPLLSARGGDGGYVDSVNFGGGGGGGLIVVMGPGINNPDLTGVVQLQGGSSGPTCGLSASLGLVAAMPQPTCIDADGDGAEHQACGGTDCLEGNPDVPRVDELCNGLDDDCDGVTDGPQASCGTGTGLVCVNSECVVEPSASSGGAEKTTVELRGGLCASAAGPRPRLGPLGWLAAAALLVLGWRRRR